MRKPRKTISFNIYELQTLHSMFLAYGLMDTYLFEKIDCALDELETKQTEYLKKKRNAK